MSAEPSAPRPRLRWWFWLVLFAPAMISVSAPLSTLLGHKYDLFSWVLLNIYIVLPMNFVCSNWAAKQIVLLRDPRGGSSPWMFLWGPLFFFLNVALVFGGCAATEQIMRSTR